MQRLTCFALTEWTAPNFPFIGGKNKQEQAAPFEIAISFIFGHCDFLCGLAHAHSKRARSMVSPHLAYCCFLAHPT
jgi:hypothetical protein